MALLDGCRIRRPKALIRSAVRGSVRISISAVRGSERSAVRISSLVRPRNPFFARLRHAVLRLPPAACVFMLCVACAFPAIAAAQTDVNDVHVVPRVQPHDGPVVGSQPVAVDSGPHDPKADTEEVAKETVMPASLSSRIRPLKVDVNLVLVPVTITDPMNRLVTGLDKENFELYEGNSKEEIKSFSSEDAPVSLGVIFDSSGSMSSKIDRAKDAVIEFFKTANPQDEFFMITFSDEPDMVADFTSSVDDIQGRLVFTVPQKRTALLDAIYMGVSKMRQAKYPKKALLIISDGGDNHSRYTENEIKALVKEADVMVYAIGIYDRYFPTEEERLGPALLGEITQLTGGRAFTVENPNDLADVATKIGTELRNQYVLGYRPTKVVRDGKWRKIKVKLLPPKGLPPLKVYARTGYYGPE